MLTTITLNGVDGVRFLTSVSARYRGALPPALAAMIDLMALPRGAASELAASELAIEVERWQADQIAELVDQLIRSGFGEVARPLLFSAAIGESVEVVRDSLVELHVRRLGDRAGPRTWVNLPRGTRGRVVSRQGDVTTLLLESGDGAGEHVSLSDRSTTLARP